MKSRVIRRLGVGGAAGVAVACLLVTAHAQDRSGKPDPRVGLKPGLRDAGEAAFNMERIAGLPKPEGFFDPSAPAGNPSPPERDPNTPPATPPPDENAPRPFDPVASNRLGFTNSDLGVRRPQRLRRELSRLQHL